MKWMGLNELRELYLKFLKARSICVLRVFLLFREMITVFLLINAGMAPLKPYFTGQEEPPKKKNG